MKTLKLSQGQFLRNGGNRIFMIANINETSVTLEEYTVNGGTEKYSRFSATVFAQLWKNKNWTEIKFSQDAAGKWREKIDRQLNRFYSADRYLVRQF